MKNTIRAIAALLIIGIVMYPWYTIIFENVKVSEVEDTWWAIDVIGVFFLSSIIENMK